jgi:hypothetical protein
MDDFQRFAVLAYRQGVKKGYLCSKSSLDPSYKQYYVLYGNLLYCYRSEDSSSFMSLHFLESSTIKATPAAHIPSSSSSASDTNTKLSYGLSITTVGGMMISLYSSMESEISGWIEAMESNKYISMIRKFEDMEVSLIQYQNRIESQDQRLNELERENEKMLAHHQQCVFELEEKNKRLHSFELELQDLRSQIKSVNAERLALLQARGVIPKTLPKWLMNRKSVSQDGSTTTILPSDDLVRIWVGTWNLGGYDVLKGIDTEQAYRYLQPFLLPGYDIYALGIQAATNEALFNVVEAYLESQGYCRIVVEPADMIRLQSSSQNMLSLAIFIRRSLRADVSVAAVSKYASSSSSSKGMVGICLLVHGRSILFLCCHLESSGKQEHRRSQYQQLITNLGSQLGEEGYHLNDQFNHIFCFGCFNSILVDKSGNALPADTAVQMLEDNLQKSLFDSHDQLRSDRRNQIVFHGYREAVPYPNFYPSYKKFLNRPRHDYTNRAWVKECYQYRYKESFYKGGGNKEKPPSFADRILYHSMVDLGEDLFPECLDESLVIHPRKPTAPQAESSHLPPSTSFSETPYGLAAEPRSPSTMTACIENYQSINDGEIFSKSDHAAIFGTFILRVKKDYEGFKAELAEKLGEGRGNIQDLFSALNASSSSPSSPSTAAVTAESSSSVARFDFSYSLLPPAHYKILLHKFKLIWGGCEDNPSSCKLLFPSPHEANAGEKFVDFYNDSPTIVDTLVDLSSSPSPPLASQASSRINKSASRRLSAASSLASDGQDRRWKNAGPSRSGSCMILECEHNLSLALPPVQLVWRGQEALDRLHVSLQIRMPATSIKSSSKLEDVSKLDYLTGHCSIGLEQLCKVALVSSGGQTGSVSLTRQLLKDGLPLYCIDYKSMQVIIPP